MIRSLVTFVILSRFVPKLGFLQPFWIGLSAAVKVLAGYFVDLIAPIMVNNSRVSFSSFLALITSNLVHNFVQPESSSSWK